MIILDPKSYYHSRNDPIWQVAMDEELNSLQKNTTWELVSLPPGRKLVQCKMVFQCRNILNPLTTQDKIINHYLINYSPTSLISWHLKVNACHLYPRNDLFLILGSSRISIQDLIEDSTFFLLFLLFLLFYKSQSTRKLVDFVSNPSSIFQDQHVFSISFKKISCFF